jgi:hypothetical protein
LQGVEDWLLPADTAAALCLQPLHTDSEALQLVQLSEQIFWSAALRSLPTDDSEEAGPDDAPKLPEEVVKQAELLAEAGWQPQPVAAADAGGSSTVEAQLAQGRRGRAAAALQDEPSFARWCGELRILLPGVD